MKGGIHVTPRTMSEMLRPLELGWLSTVSRWNASLKVLDFVDLQNKSNSFSVLFIWYVTYWGSWEFSVLSCFWVCHYYCLFLLDHPKIYVNPASQSTNEFSAIHMACHLEGKPKSTVRWLKDGNYITPGSRITVSQPNSVSNTSATLTIANVTRHDEGNYSCEAENDVGNVTSSQASLVVNCKYLIDS